MTAVDDVRVEVAFSADPNTTSPTWVDLTSRARMDVGIDITRGRQDEASAVQAGTCSLTLDNTDGALTPGLVSSPFYPNVKPQNRIRVTYRDPAAAGNFLLSEDAGFEGGTVGSWVGLTGGSPTNSAVRADTGTKSMLVTWPTAGANGSGAALTYGPGYLTIGRSYTVRARVWVAAGSAPVRIGFVQSLVGFYGSQSTTTGAWETISSTFTTVTSNLQIYIRPNAATTAGQQVWVDSIRVDETASPSTFTTDGVPITHRFDGYVDEWPTAWPLGGQTESTSSITAVDLQSRINRKRSLDSVIAETVKQTGPLWYFPLGEDSDSSSAGDRMGTGSTVAPVQVGSGGTLEFSGGTGPGTDGAGAPLFTPVSAGNGKYLRGSVSRVPFLNTAITLEATFRTSVNTRIQTVARWADGYGFRVALQTDATGKAQATFRNPWDSSKDITVTSANVYADNRTHDAALTLINDGAGTVTLTLYIDGVSRGTGTYSTGSIYLYGLSELWIGGAAAFEEGDVFSGTISHVAGIASGVSAGSLSDRYEAVSTGFAGERSDQRIARIASWAGIPTGLQSLDVGQSTIAHVDSSGLNAWEYMQQVATTESGLLFVSTNGLLTFYNRAHSYDVAAAVDISVDAELVGPDARIVNSLADVANDVTVDRAGGATARVTDAASITAYGVLSTSVSLISNTDADAFDRANWILATSANPTPRLPELTLDGLTDTATSPSVRWLGLDDRVAVTGMPSQSPTSAFDLRVQGYREVIGRGGWYVTANLTPYLAVTPLILDDNVYGLLDSENRLVY